MKIIKPDQVPKELVTDPDFTGGKVTRQTIVNRETGQDLIMYMIHFSKGSGPPFHTHTGDQILILTAGKGLVATEQEERVVFPGDIIFFAAGEKQWHGASNDSDASYMYVLPAWRETIVVKD